MPTVTSTNCTKNEEKVKKEPPQDQAAKKGKKGFLRFREASGK